MKAGNRNKVLDSSIILSRFVREGRIIRLPAKQNMRLVVLAWLADKFSPDKNFPESEINQILVDHEVDHAYLRRSLVDFGFLKRDSGIYQRT